jgi:hypothetical protein
VTRYYNYKNNVVDKLRDQKVYCALGVRRVGLKCKRGDFVHIKKGSEPNKYHISVTDAEGSATLPDVDDTDSFDTDAVV